MKLFIKQILLEHCRHRAKYTLNDPGCGVKKAITIISRDRHIIYMKPYQIIRTEDGG